MKILLLLLLGSALTDACAQSGPEQAWARIAALRQGPGTPPEGAPEKVVQIARNHLLAQEKTLGDFITRYPDDPRRFEAEIEYAAVMSSLGVSLSDRTRLEKSLQRLAALEKAKSTPSKVKADAAFQRITTTMQTVNIAASARLSETANARNTILESAGNFAARYPEDRRAARLLAEVATLFDDQPSRKRKVLEQASTLARDDGTRQRISDDLKRLALLGQPLDVSFPTMQGGSYATSSERGRVVVLVFWASWSPPSVAWLAEFADYAKSLPSGRVSIVTVNLDRDPAHCRQTLKKLQVENWPTSSEGDGWENKIARQLGVNALPTIFICDSQGRLRVINARQDYAAVLRQLLTEKPAP
jgi:thiol-disulfide isomerase/thioredoxin